jgi:hypothetical protein
VRPWNCPELGGGNRSHGTPGAVLRGLGAALSREVGIGATAPPQLPCAGRRVLPPELPRAGLLLTVSGDFFLVASYCPTKHSSVLKKNFFNVLAATTPLTLSLSSWFLLQLLHVLFQCCDVRCSLTTPTIMTGFLAYVCTCVDFIFGIFSWASFPARRLLRLLLSL